MSQEPFFLTRGVVLVTRDIATLDWPTRAREAGLTTIATHIFPQEIADFLGTEPGQRFLQQCRDLGLHVEHELHAMGELLPRALFDRNPAMFRLDANLAVFGTDGAQVLEYWMDCSRFSGWKRDKVGRLPWNREVFLDDVALYAARGIRHVTQFATWLDGWYVEHFGEPPVAEYGAGLLARRPIA